MKYIVHWDNQITNQNRAVSPAGVTKFDYILGLYHRNHVNAEIISPAYAKKDGQWHEGNVININNYTCVKYFKNCGKNNIFAKFFNRLSVRLGMYYYLCKNVKLHETVYLYHTLDLMWVVKYLKKHKKCDITLEVEEIYSDVTNNEKIKKKELKTFTFADKYIFPTESLNQIVNVQNKPYLMAHGTYDVVEQRVKKYDDGKVHIVYAGTLDPTKGGAYMAVDTARYLDNNYHLHIIGFGSKTQQENLIERISEVQNVTSCQIDFDGVKQGEEYIDYIQKCHIGLSTQDPNGVYNNSSFPSKVLSYMANGLRVVTTRIPVLEESDVKDLLYFYEGYLAKNIAITIKKINTNDDYDSRKLIKQLDTKSLTSMKNII